MATYSPQGKPHKLLELLSQGETSFVALAERMPGGTAAARKRKTWHTICALVEDRLVAGHRAGYVITQSGMDVLQGLRGDRSICVGNVTSARVFPRTA